MHDQTFFLTKHHKDQLKKEYSESRPQTLLGSLCTFRCSLLEGSLSTWLARPRGMCSGIELRCLPGLESDTQGRNVLDVEAWTFEQFDGEAVFIPAGCPHQVRNLKVCVQPPLLDVPKGVAAFLDDFLQRAKPNFVWEECCTYLPPTYR